MQSAKKAIKSNNANTEIEINNRATTIKKLIEVLYANFWIGNEAQNW